MKWLELPLFPIMLAASFFGHGTAFGLWMLWHIIGFVPPEPIPPQMGVASVRLVPNEATRAQPTDPLKDLPIEEKINPPPLPRQPEPKEKPKEQPREAVVTPKITPEDVTDLIDAISRLVTPLQTVQATAPAKTTEAPRAEPVAAEESPEPTPIPAVKTFEKHEPKKPFSMTKPKVELPRVDLPRVEPVEKVAEQDAKPSPASQESEGVVDELPRKLPINPPPRYPAEDQRLGHEGVVWLKLTISAEGRVTDISILTSSGYQSLDDSALSTVRRWLFEPARYRGRPLAYTVRHKVNFYIER
jgi:protein TonB